MYNRTQNQRNNVIWGVADETKHNEFVIQDGQKVTHYQIQPSIRLDYSPILSIK